MGDNTNNKTSTMTLQLHEALNEVDQRRNKILHDIKDAHKLQIKMLKSEMAAERIESAKAQQVFEETLRLKYDNLVTALQEKINIEQEVRMQQALEDLERNARLESERAKQSMELQQNTEVALALKFKNIVGDLRKSWEEEELQRAKFLEDRLRGHYSAVLEHMESQLQIALQLQDDADRRWMEDVQERNKQQIETMRAFEGKCTRIYESRLREYVSQSEELFAKYENQLLESGSNMALEKHQFQSKQRRLRLACSKWKAEYQKHLHEKYTSLLNAVENRYCSEIESLLDEISNLRKNIVTVQENVNETETNMFQQYKSNRVMDSTLKTPQSIRMELEMMWNKLDSSPEERINTLVSLLDKCNPTPELAMKYQDLMTKLHRKLPIHQAISRKQFIEYKLKLSIRDNSSNSSTSGISQLELNNELHDLNELIEQLTSQYEIDFNEHVPSHYTNTNSNTNTNTNMNDIPENIDEDYNNTNTNSLVSGKPSLNLTSPSNVSIHSTISNVKAIGNRSMRKLTPAMTISSTPKKY